MPKKSAESKRTSPARKAVRKSAAELAPASAAELDRLRAAMGSAIKMEEIPERREFRRLKRDADGALPRRKSLIREAVVQRMESLGLTVYRLWQLAKVHYPPLSQGAIHEFIKGQRQLELPSIEALLTALDLRVVNGSLSATKRTARLHNKKSA
jgi:hypothetical protein